MLPRRVCDPCHSRKVRCDRDDPCGNCQDQNVACTRTRRMKRLPKRDLAPIQGGENEGSSDGALVVQPSIADRQSPPVSAPQDEASISHGLPPHVEVGLVNIPGEESSLLLDHLGMSHELPSWMALIPLTDAQMMNRPQSRHSQSLVWSRREALESALSVAIQISGGMEQGTNMPAEMANNEEQRTIPSLEFLYWMLNGIESDRFGPFVQDFFRHIGKGTLNHMGLSLNLETATASEALIYTVCVNSVAYKFLNTVVTAGEDIVLTQTLQQSALLYRETAKRALRKIPLVTKPSLSLLQAILCGIFLYQAAGDASTCQELAKTACRVCRDIDLHPGAAGLHNAREEEYYCFMWCYILDRNYAWKIGRPRYLTVGPNTSMDLPTSRINSSALFLIYYELSKVQDKMIPFLVHSTEEDSGICQSFTFTGVSAELMRRMDCIKRNIDQIRSPSTNWTGLDHDCEIATLDFAYYSIMTNISHLYHITPGQAAVDKCLGSARQELLALITICESGDTQKTVPYLHWTILHYPITACFALFCNVVATCHNGDFQILNAVAECLAQGGSLSQPIATMQKLLRQLVDLSRYFFTEEILTASMDDSHTQSLFSQLPENILGNSPFELPSWIDSSLLSGDVHTHDGAGY